MAFHHAIVLKCHPTPTPRTTGVLHQKKLRWPYSAKQSTHCRSSLDDTHKLILYSKGMNPSPEPTISAVYAFDRKGELKRPLFACSVSAGFPSPADDYIEGRLDLNELMVANPAATFFVRVAGDSMIGAGIHHNDILVVDRSLEPTSGKVVIAVVNNELTVKRLIKNGENICLKAESHDYPDIQMTEGNTCEIWGVVAFVVHAL